MMWMVRNPSGTYVQELLKQGVVGIGWPEVVPHLVNAQAPEDFYAAIQKTAPVEGPGDRERRQAALQILSRDKRRRHSSHVRLAAPYLPHWHRYRACPKQCASRSPIQ